MRNRGHQLICRPEGCWLCSQGCSKIFQHLQKLIGKSVSTPIEGLSCTVLRFYRENGNENGDYDDATMAEHYGKLRIVLDVLHECFVTIIEPRTQSDLSEDIVFNRESELRRLNFRGFYTIVLQKGGELVSVGTFRVCGRKFAELPLIGTRVPYRRQGMCRLLMNELEKLLTDLGVEKLLLPAVPQLLETWTGSFGFTVMSNSDRLELAENSILSFQGTTMCQKILNAACNNPQDHRVPSMSDSERIGLAEDNVLSFNRTTVCDKVVNIASDHSEVLKATMVPNSDRELAENSILYSPGTNICQKVSINTHSHPGLKGFDNQLEDTRVIGEAMECDGSSVVMEVTEQLEPELLLEVRNNSCEEGICPADAPTSTPDRQVGFTGDRHEQPYGSAGADQCSENCTLTEVKPVTQTTAPALKYKFSGKCYERIKKGTRRNVWLRVSTK
uniref:N-acetyltransferase domain-containing protein n=1 Tax=Arundo donax TaxID=35708 RepID=A0A0A9DZT5_ARUDO